MGVPGMEARKGRVDHLRPRAGDVQQHQGALGQEPVHAQRVLGRVPPGAVGEFVWHAVERNG